MVGKIKWLGEMAPAIGAQRGRAALMVLLDAACASISVFLALQLRFEFRDVPPEQMRTLVSSLPTLIAIRVALGVVLGVHRWSFRLAGIVEAFRLALASVAGTFCFAASFYFSQRPGLPRSVLALELFFTTGMTAGYRFLPRLANRWFAERAISLRTDVQRTLILGAGSAGDLLLRDLNRSGGHNYHVLGFVDDNETITGTTVGGKPVLGTTARLPDLVQKYEIAKVLIAVPKLSGERLRALLDSCAALKVGFKRVPATFTSTNGRMTAAILHDLSPDDLLPRDSVAFDVEEIRGHVSGKCVLVTGAAGSIGSEIVRQVARNAPAKVVLVDINENEMYFLYRRLRECFPSIDVHAQVADIRDAAKILRLGEEYRPNYVFHAAAHKHVPLMEDAPEEAVKNNIFGTENVARMADACGVEKFVLISTDKAVRPTSVMGASKRVAEFVVRSMARQSKTKFTAVRFGNVLGSAGSVVPLFKQQIERGGPVTVTHRECRRYFMTIPEAVGLVLIAGLNSYGDLCVLEMGEAIKIDDLARNLITMAGLVPDVDVKVEYTGLRPGEKLMEELLTEEEEQSQVVRNRIRVARSPLPSADLHAGLDRLRHAATMADRTLINDALKAIVPTYSPEQGASEEPGAAVVRLFSGTRPS